MMEKYKKKNNNNNIVACRTVVAGGIQTDGEAAATHARVSTVDLKLQRPWV